MADARGLRKSFEPMRDDDDDDDDGGMAEGDVSVVFVHCWEKGGGKVRLEGGKGGLFNVGTLFRNFFSEFLFPFFFWRHCRIKGKKIPISLSYMIYNNHIYCTSSHTRFLFFLFFFFFLFRIDRCCHRNILKTLYWLPSASLMS